MSERIKKVNEVLKRELGKIVLKEIDLPSGVLVTLIKVETSKDLGQSKVFVSVFPVKETESVLGILNKETYNLHQSLNKVLFIRRVPKIRFVEEKQLQKVQKVNEILDKLTP